MQERTDHLRQCLQRSSLLSVQQRSCLSNRRESEDLCQSFGSAGIGFHFCFTSILLQTFINKTSTKSFMFYKKEGYPEEEEIVFCKVSKILPNSVFVELLEYGEQGLVHISEIAPGRIRNLRDYVVEGKQIVCKVLRIDRSKGHIDLSLRRVGSHQRQAKLDEIKQELTAETLIQNMAKRMQKPVEELYKQVTEKIFKEYSHLYLCFKDVAAGEASLETLGLDKKISEELTAAIVDRFKPSKITIKGEIKIQSYASDGVERIRSVLLGIEKISPTINLFYLGGGRFKVTIEDIDYNVAEQTMKKIQEMLEKFNDKSSTAVFEREKTE